MIRDEEKTKAELLEEIKTLRHHITELERAKYTTRGPEVRESDHVFQTVFSDAADGILVADVDSKKFRMANTRLCQMLGYSLKEIQCLGIAYIHPEKDQPFVAEQFTRQAKGELSLVKDIPVKRIDGSVFYADVNSMPITLEGKECLIGIFRDVTDRRNTEKALHESRIKYRMLLENLPQKIFLKDRDSVYISCNENYARDLKISSEGIAGKTDYDFFPNELAEKYKAADMRGLESGETKGC